jgi:predicted alpha/beta-hydrolase family hydrolase
LFVHGTRDPFGSMKELDEARQLIPAKAEILPVEGAGHDLGFARGKKPEALAAEIVRKFLALAP